MLDGLMPADEARKTELTRFLNTSGYYGRRAVIKFQLVRLISAVGFGMVTALLYGRLYPNHPFVFAIGASMFLTLLGYMLPKTIVSLGRDRLFEEHRQGFPDFLDLLVICVEAGIGIDSAIDRVGRDLSRSYPSLSRNLRFMSLELRAGRSTREALENLSGRLGIEEARSFATLIQQSEELGSSLVQSLRVYSDEMRAKRLSRAEEKAHSLPVKLVLPLALFIFPVILGITLMPVAIKVFQALKI
jgi:tight adherence protein C